MKCIFIDIDGTLLDHELGVQESSKIAIQKARKNGHKVCLATGRAKSEVPIELFDIGFDGFIYSSGGLVEIREQTLFEEVMNKKDIINIINLLHQKHIGFNLEGINDSFLDTIAYTYFYNLFKNSTKMNSDFTEQYMESIHLLPYHKLQENDYDQIVKIAIFAKTHNVCLSLQEKLPNHIKLTLHGVDEGPMINGEISNVHLSKATGMDHILHYFQIPRSQSIAIGDSMNDADMIVHAQCGVAMANACAGLIELCDEQTTSSKEDGIYCCLKKHMII